MNVSALINRQMLGCCDYNGLILWTHTYTRRTLPASVCTSVFCRWSRSCPTSTPVRGCLKEFMPTFRTRWVSKLGRQLARVIMMWWKWFVGAHVASQQLGSVTVWWWAEHRNRCELWAGTARLIVACCGSTAAALCSRWRPRVTRGYNRPVQCSLLWLKELQLYSEYIAKLRIVITSGIRVQVFYAQYTVSTVDAFLCLCCSLKHIFHNQVNSSSSRPPISLWKQMQSVERSVSVALQIREGFNRQTNKWV